MCLDIDPDSVIHKHLNQKINSLYEDNGDGTDYNPVIGDNYENEEDNWVHQSKHKLTMLPSFHISLGAPLQNIKPESINPPNHPTDIACLVGLITLSPIHISENKNKKSAWIPIDPMHIRIGPSKIKAQLHISLANLTGNPRDSIARPEDCIIDTITA